MRLVRPAQILILLLFTVSTAFAAGQTRPADWAQPITDAGIKNLYRVDAGLYRSSQPDAEQMKRLQALGVREVLSLRHYHSDDDEARGTDLKLHRVAMDAGEITDENMLAALKIIKARRGPLLVHCWHGSDRTGAVIAMHRILVQNWSTQAAIDEMLHGGYGFHEMYQSIVRYIEAADVPKLRRELGMK